MQELLPGIIMSLREGLEAFLIVAMILKFLEKTDSNNLKKSVWAGTIGSIVVSIIFGYGLFLISSKLNSIGIVGKIWESFASIFAVALVASFIIWMINNTKNIKQHIENKVSLNLSKIGIALVSFALVAREGVEIAIFSFAGKYSILSIIIGLLIALAIVVGISYSLIKVNLNTLFKITLVYLIIQAGYLLGYGVHEGISALKAGSLLSSTNLLTIKLFNLSGTILNHKQGLIGLPLNVLIGWYSKPEWIQFLIQYLFTGGLFAYWYKVGAKLSINQ